MQKTWSGRTLWAQWTYHQKSNFGPWWQNKSWVTVSKDIPCSDFFPIHSWLDIEDIETHHILWAFRTSPAAGSIDETQSAIAAIQASLPDNTPDIEIPWVHARLFFRPSQFSMKMGFYHVKDVLTYYIFCVCRLPTGEEAISEHEPSSSPHYSQYFEPV